MITAAVSFGILHSGCGTVGRSEWRSSLSKDYYPAVHFDIEVMAGYFSDHPPEWWTAPIAIPCCLIDLPISVVTDSIMLIPDHIYARKARGGPIAPAADADAESSLPSGHK
jgi:uncharacterized protein YceK